MTPRIGEHFAASVLWADGSGANILILDPAVITWMETPAGQATPEPGSVVDVLLVGIDQDRGYLQLVPVRQQSKEDVETASGVDAVANVEGASALGDAAA